MTATPYTNRQIFLAAVKDCDTSIIRVLQEGGDVNQIIDTKMSLIVSLLGIYIYSPLQLNIPLVE